MVCNKLKRNWHLRYVLYMHNNASDTYLPKLRYRFITPKPAGSYVSEVLNKCRLGMLGGLRDMRGFKKKFSELMGLQDSNGPLKQFIFSLFIFIEP